MHMPPFSCSKGIPKPRCEHDPDVPENGKLTVTARVTSPQPIVGASVIATLGGKSNLLDNGFGVDEQANDGIYSQSVFAPNLLSFNLAVLAKASGYEDANKVYQPEP